MATTKTAEQLFEKMNPQDGKLPQWAKEFAMSFASLQTSELIEAVEKVREKITTVANSVIGIDGYAEGYLGALEDCKKLLGELLKTHKPTPPISG